MPSKPLRLAVLGSTRGTVMQAIIDAIQSGELNASIEIVISNKADAIILQRAKDHNIEAQFVDPKGLSREAYDESVANILKEKNVGLILLIGYMRIISQSFTDQWPRKILNVHPSLLPKHQGLMNEQVHQAVLDAKEKETGCTIHYVNEVVDAGEVVLQKRCRVDANDTVALLKEKVQVLEAQAYIEAIQQVAH